MNTLVLPAGASNTSPRLMGSLLLASLIAIGLFWLMSQMIKPQTPPVDQSLPSAAISLIEPPAPIPPASNRQQTTLPEKPLLPAPLPSNTIVKQQLKPSFTTPKISLPTLPLNQPVPLLPPQIAIAKPSLTNQSLIPLFRVPPLYPPHAARRNIEGEVTVRFTINRDGSVSNAKVTAAKPKGVFDRAALNAIAKFRFKPRVINGQVVAQQATQTLVFQLRD